MLAFDALAKLPLAARRQVAGTGASAGAATAEAIAGAAGFANRIAKANTLGSQAQTAKLSGKQIVSARPSIRPLLKAS
jgi:hypothetical protein